MYSKRLLYDGCMLEVVLRKKREFDAINSDVGYQGLLPCVPRSEDAFSVSRSVKSLLSNSSDPHPDAIDYLSLSQREAGYKQCERRSQRGLTGKGKALLTAFLRGLRQKLMVGFVA